MDRSVNKIAKKALDEAKALVLPKINEKLRDELPMAVPQSCGTDCGLPDGVELSYKIPHPPKFVALSHIEALATVEICTSDLGTSEPLCFPPHDPLAPPTVEQRQFTTP